ncbi:transcription initiation factor IIB family protein [Candidatus Woesearchaeota archaeon]|nr:transcription initiation factor IIB family protein [Candidatus Woesearchaeota archaeon]
MKCPECGSIQLRWNYEKGESYCHECGLIVEDHLPERFSILPEGKVAHAPGSIKAGSHLPDGKFVKAAWVFKTREKNVMQAKKKIEFVTSKLHFPSQIGKDAGTLYHDAVYKDLNIGRDNSSLIYACIYAACRQHQRPTTCKELLEYASKTTTKELLSSFRLLKDQLEINLPLFDPVDYVYKYTAELDLSPKTTTKIIQLVERIKKTNLFEGRHPESVVAAAIYLGCKLNKEPKSQRAISAVVGVIEITIRKRFREIEERLSLS